MKYQRSQIVFVDIQSVVGNNGQLFVKELVYMFANSISPMQYILKPPYAYEELNDFAVNQEEHVYQNINKLRWNDGNIDYLQLPQILYNIQEFIIVVKGNQKKKFLEKYLSNVVDLDVKTSLKTLRSYFHGCQIHEPSFHRCAILNVFKLLFFMEKNTMLTE